MSQIRAPAVAGQFYPAKADELLNSVDKMLAEAETDEACPKAIIDSPFFTIKDLC